MPCHPFRLVLAIAAAAVLSGTSLIAAPAPAAAHPHGPTSDDYTFVGGGWGHGAGMSQFGALGRADAGLSHKEILAFYYEGTDLLTDPSLVPDDVDVRIAVHTRTVFRPTGLLTVSMDGRFLDTTRNTLTVSRGSGGWHINSSSINWCRGFCSGTRLTVSFNEGEVVQVSGTTNGTRRYAYGQFQLTPAGPGVTNCGRRAASQYCLVIGEMTMQQYLYGLDEVYHTWPVEAHKAQVIAGRSYAVAQIRDRRGWSSPFDLYTSTRDQQYRAWDHEAEAHPDRSWQDAVDATDDTVVVHWPEQEAAAKNSDSGDGAGGSSGGDDGSDGDSGDGDGDSSGGNGDSDGDSDGGDSSDGDSSGGDGGSDGGDSSDGDSSGGNGDSDGGDDDSDGSDDDSDGSSDSSDGGSGGSGSDSNGSNDDGSGGGGSDGDGNGSDGDGNDDTSGNDDGSGGNDRGEPRVITAFYTSSNGGYTASSEEYRNKPLSYLLAKPDPYDAAPDEIGNPKNPFHTWERTYTGTQISEWLADYPFADLDVGDLQEMHISGAGPSGRIDHALVTLVGSERTIEVLNDDGEPWGFRFYYALLLGCRNTPDCKTPMSTKMALSGTHDDSSIHTLPFTDVRFNAPYARAVQWMFNNGISGGTTDSTFSPDQPLTRAQFATMLWRFAGSPNTNNPSTNSSTNDSSNTHNNNTSIYNNSINISNTDNSSIYNNDSSSTGTSTDNTNDSNSGGGSTDNNSGGSTASNPGDSDSDTGSGGGSTGFSDVAPDSYYAAAVTWMVGENIALGCDTRDDSPRFCPQEPLTTSQIVAFLWRFAGRKYSNHAVPFTDIGINDYYLEASRWMVEHPLWVDNALRPTDGSPALFMPGETVTRSRMSVLLWRLAAAPAAFDTDTALPPLMRDP